ncbi:MAG: hypothetical protein PHN82_05585 [bacterium]|nr:hypothetical protein [bacterium]
MKKALAFAAVAALCACVASPALAQYTVLHQFAGQPDDGSYPVNGLCADGSTLYGMTNYGGAIDEGTIFSMNPDGGAYTVIHDFAGQPADGAHPIGTLVSDGSKLYGMTYYGGANDYGSIFSIKPDGTGLALLRSFNATTDGNYPYGSLLLQSGKLYGMTRYGGTSDEGTVFSINTGGTGYTTMHSFQGTPNDGRGPRGGLISDGSKLYGMTYYGGANDYGTIFSMNAAGGGFTVIHDFAGPPDDGTTPCGTLVSDGSTLYGLAYYGGANDEGAVFAIKPDGTGFTLLHSFDFTGAQDAAWPMGDLTLVDGTLYGATTWGGTGGGTYGYGAIFTMGTDGGGYTVLHSFASMPNDGEYPGQYSGLLFHDYTLYGMSEEGGTNDIGTIFSYALPTPTPTPVPQAEILLNGSSFKIGDRFQATFRLNETVAQPFNAYAVVQLPDGSMLDCITLGKKIVPVATNVPRLDAPFTYPLMNLNVPGGAPDGDYRVMAGFFTPGQPVTKPEDAFLLATTPFRIDN